MKTLAIAVLLVLANLQTSGGTADLAAGQVWTIRNAPGQSTRVTIIDIDRSLPLATVHITVEGLPYPRLGGRIDHLAIREDALQNSFDTLIEHGSVLPAPALRAREDWEYAPIAHRVESVAISALIDREARISGDIADPPDTENSCAFEEEQRLVLTGHDPERIRIRTIGQVRWHGDDIILVRFEGDAMGEINTPRARDRYAFECQVLETHIDGAVNWPDVVFFSVRDAASPADYRRIASRRVIRESPAEFARTVLGATIEAQ